MVGRNWYRLTIFPTVACVLSRDKIVVCQNAESFKTRCPESFLQEFKLDIANSPDCNGVDYQKVVAEILRYIKGCSEVENNGVRLDSNSYDSGYIYRARFA